MLPLIGCVEIGEWKYGDWGTVYHQSFIQDVFLHELGHALGIGTGSNWFEQVVWPEEGHPYFDGPSAIAAYNALPRLVGAGGYGTGWILGEYSKAALEQPGGSLYKGEKVPLLGGVHWGETIGGELVALSPIVSIDTWPQTKLSTISLGALEDQGYPVRYENADPFWVEVDSLGNPTTDSSWIDLEGIDQRAGKPTVSSWCGVGQ